MSVRDCDWLNESCPIDLALARHEHRVWVLHGGLESEMIVGKNGRREEARVVCDVCGTQKRQMKRREECGEVQGNRMAGIIVFVAAAVR